MRNDFQPIFAGRVGDRRFDQTEIAAGVVDAKVEKIAIVIGVVFDVLFARLDDFPIGHRLIGRNVAGIGRGVAS